MTKQQQLQQLAAQISTTQRLIGRRQKAPPEWGCSQWGQRDHDWLECTECAAKYDGQREGK
jgi:hypothetical protein